MTHGDLVQRLGRLHHVDDDVAGLNVTEARHHRRMFDGQVRERRP
jgi:hypothetical protein